MSGIGGQANNMDSINRPTSRVLAPPGGGCSNIFGGEPEPVKAFNKNDPRHKTNNIFGGAQSVQKENKSTPTPTETPKVASASGSQNTNQPEVKPVGVSLYNLPFPPQVGIPNTTFTFH